MYKDPGQKVMTLATVFAVILGIIAIIEGIVIWVGMAKVRQGGLGFLLFIVVAAVGCVIAYISYIMLYAFGELVDNTSQILKKMPDSSMFQAQSGIDKIHRPGERMYPNAVPEKPTATPAPEKNTVTCPFCKKESPKGTVFCGGCGAKIGTN